LNPRLWSGGSTQQGQTKQQGKPDPRNKQNCHV